MTSKAWMNTGRATRAAALMMLALLAACGGGTQVERFTPARIVVFGDENSVIESDGRKYTVNGYNTATPPVLDCVVNPVWIQFVAGEWNMHFPQCGSTAADTRNRIYAFNGAKVSGLAAQIDSAGALGSTDLTTVFIGANDLLEIYAQYNGSNESALLTLAQSAADVLAGQIARIAATGARVVFLTVPELGSMPFAAKENAAHPGEDRAALLTRLTTAFNARLRTDVSDPRLSTYIDGHQGVQVLADELFHTIVANVGTTATTFVNGSDPICDPAKAATVLDCHDSTDPAVSTLITSLSTPALVSGGTASNYLWADDKHLSPGGHATLGTTAENRINANPL